MHERFADWYRLATPGIDHALPPDLLDRRWAGLEAAIKEMSPGDELNLVRLFLRPSQAAPAYVSKFRGAFKKVDAGLLTQENELELSVLAGIVIVDRFRWTPHNVAERAGLAVLCEHAIPSTVSPAWAEPLISEIVNKYEERCKDIRGPVSVTPGAFDKETLQSSFNAFSQAFPTTDWPKIQDASTSAMSALLGSLLRYAETTKAALESLETEQELRQQETSILWWMTGEYSRDLDRRLADVKLPGAALVAGKELADLVTLPGPLSAKSFLDRILTSCGAKAASKPIELKAAVNAVPSNWRSAISSAPGFSMVKDLCPILGAVADSLATDEKEDWLPMYRKAYQRDPALTIPSVDFAHQTYREWLLVRSVAEFKRKS